MCFNSSTRLYCCQLDEQWFNLHKDILRDALNITPANDNNPFVAPPSSDTVIEYVNTLGYPSTLKNVSAMSVNALYQPWRANLSMINMCLTGKTAGYDRPRHPVLQILWGIIHRSNIDYAERIWEEFVQSIQTFLTDRKNLATNARGKKKTAHLLIPSVRFTKLIIHHLRTKHNIHPRTGSPLHYSHDENVLNTLRFMGKDGREIFRMLIPDNVARQRKEEQQSSKTTKVTKPKAAKVTKPAGDPAPKKRKMVKETSDDPLPAKRSKAGLVGKRRKAKSPLRLIDEPSDEGVPVEEPAHDDEEADIQRALELSLKEQGERTQGPARLVVLREPVSEKFQPLPEVQGKGKEKVVEEQAAHDLLTLQTPKKKSPTEQFIFQRRPPMPTESSAHAESPSMDVELNLTDSETESDEEASKINARNQDEDQAGPNPGVQDEDQAGPNPGVQDEGQAGPNPGIAIESQLQSSHVVHAGPNLEHMDLGTSDASTQQKHNQMDEEFTTTAYPNEEELRKTNAEAKVQSMVLVPIDQNTSSVPPMTTPVIDLTKSNLSEAHSQAVDEIVTDAVDWAMQAPFQARFRDLPTVDMKEILQQWMFEDNSYYAHDVHNDLYEALQKSLELDYTNQRLADQEEASKNRQKRRDLPPPPPPLSTGTSRAAQQQGSKAPSSSKTAASASQSMAWTTSDTQFESTDFTATQVLLSDDEDSGNDHLPKVDSRQDWWKPLPEEERPATPKPAWTIPSSYKSDVENNWASALATTYEPPAENSLLAKTRDMTTFLKEAAYYLCSLSSVSLELLSYLFFLSSSSSSLLSKNCSVSFRSVAVRCSLLRLYFCSISAPFVFSSSIYDITSLGSSRSSDRPRNYI
ncbi:retrovirus-related pol polyprotein from transposon TNT 1-94 [Tanacetum coccineum]